MPRDRAAYAEQMPDESEVECAAVDTVTLECTEEDHNAA